MKKFFAQVISSLFHPVVLALFAPAIIIRHAYSDMSYSFKWMIFSSLFLFGVLFALYFFRKDKFFSDFDFYHKESRPLFYIICFFFTVAYFLAAFFIKGIAFPLSIVAFTILVGLVMFDVMNKYLKVSVHVAVASAFVIMMCLLYPQKTLWISVWILPLMIWSRLYLGKHTKMEVLAGLCLGVFITLTTVIMVKIIQS